MRLLLILLLLFLGCDKDPLTPEDSYGIIYGSIIYEGGHHSPAVINMSTEPSCESYWQDLGEIPYDDSWIVNEEGGVENIFIWLEEVGEENTYIENEPYELNIQGCMYNPPSFGLMINQTLIINNYDDAIHNIHFMSSTNPENDYALPTTNSTKEISFEYAETPFRIKDDVQPWMEGYVGIFSNPYYTLTGTDGYYEINNIPNGVYNIKVWHKNIESGSYVITPESTQIEIDNNNNELVINFILAQTGD